MSQPIAYVSRAAFDSLPRYVRTASGRRLAFRGVIGQRSDGVILLGCPVEQAAHRRGWIGGVLREVVGFLLTW